MVGLRDDGGRRARRNPLPPHSGYHDRDGCRVAVGARRRWRGRDDRPRVDGAGVAPDRAPGGRPRHRTGVRAGDRVADAGGTEAGAGGSGRHGVKTGDRDRFGAMMGSALGGVAFAEAQVPKYLAQGPRGLDASLALAVFAGAASCNIAIEFGLTGPNATNAMSCASGTIAVGEAFHV